MGIVKKVLNVEQNEQNNSKSTVCLYKISELPIYVTTSLSG